MNWILTGNRNSPGVPNGTHKPHQWMGYPYLVPNGTHFRKPTICIPRPVRDARWVAPQTIIMRRVPLGTPGG